MDKLSIVLHEERTVFAPHETVRGAIEWSLNKAPCSLDLSLFWYTTGKGTRDIGVAETSRFDDPGRVGSRDFSFMLPQGPYSFSGKLVSLIWAIELTCSPGSETIRREITLSPTGQEIVLGDASSRNRFPWGQDGSGPNPLERILGIRK